jgi:hypothetical protein
MKKIWVWCTFEFVGWHVWKDAPQDVNYLAERHRHLFKCKVQIEVSHNDREIEFITLKNECSEMIPAMSILDVGSCEMVAEWIYGRLKHMYPGRSMKIAISEDGENGATVEFD